MPGEQCALGLNQQTLPFKLLPSTSSWVALGRWLSFSEPPFLLWIMTERAVVTIQAVPRALGELRGAKGFLRRRA